MTTATASDAPPDVLVTKADGVATITINRPECYNAYSTGTLQRMARALQEASFDDSIGVIVLTGAGTRAFCTGGDVKEYAEKYTREPHEYWKYMQLFRSYIEAILRTGKPTIARINGICVGGGNETQLACDLSIMAEHAYLGQVGTSVGSVACGGATQWLPLVVGAKRACEMLMLNPKIPARKAMEWGLVNEVVPTVKREGRYIEQATREEIELALKGAEGYEIDLQLLDRVVLDYARQLLEKFPECMRYTKQQVNFWKELGWYNTIGHGADWLSLHFATVEPFEGMRAFVEKRRPNYAGLRESLAQGRSPEFHWGAPVRTCSTCGARFLPETFAYCGACGGKL